MIEMFCLLITVCDKIDMAYMYIHRKRQVFKPLNILKCEI
jgi:hypothetical protein